MVRKSNLFKYHVNVPEMLLKIFLCLVIIGFIALCNRCRQPGTDKDFRKGNDGVLIKIHNDIPGDTVQIGDFAETWLEDRTEDDSIIYRSSDYDNRSRLIFRDKTYFLGDFNAGLGMLSEGDSATVKLRLDSLLEKMGMENLAKVKGTYLLRTVKIGKIIRRGGLSDSAFNIEYQNFRENQIEQAKISENTKLANFIAAMKTKPKVTNSGVHYLINRPGVGLKASINDTIAVNYTAKYLSGKVFETSEEAIAKRAGIFRTSRVNSYGPVKMVMPATGPYSGFQEAALTFPKGTRVTLVIPSRLAYGSNGGAGIPPYTPLLCEMEIVDIIHPNGGQVSQMSESIKTYK